MPASFFRAVPALLLTAVFAAACASAPATMAPVASAGPAPSFNLSPPTPDPRVGLEPGLWDAGVAAWNMRLVSNTPSPEGFDGVTNSDLAFIGDLAIQGNYNGVQVWDISNPARPSLRTSYLCPASQSDVSIYRNLMFVSGESTSGRLDCGAQGVTDSISHERLRGIRIFDVTDITAPKYVANVQTCRGSHTHTVVSDPRDAASVYIYVSGSSRVRSPQELPGCSDLAPDQDPNSALFRIEVIRVPLANPQAAAIVSSPRIFEDLVAPPRHAENPADIRRPANAPAGAAATAAAAAAPLPGPTQCHDITVYPAIGLAGGACGGYGLLLDIRDVRNPRRLYAAADSNFSFWHSATFSNDGSKVVFTDEWGGGSAPRCRATDKYEWGANALFSRVGNELVFESYYKMPAAQTALENCVAHNGSLIPIPGRDVMVQGWYQGGVSIFDFTDVENPVEIAFYDRGPVNGERLQSAGSWSIYWYNGVMVSSEIRRGLDIFELLPSPMMTQNEIDAAKTVRFEWLNTQEQPQLTWPPSFALARAFVDQLERSGGLAAAQLSSTRSDLNAAERAAGTARREALNALAGRLDAAVSGSRDQAKLRMLATAVRDLANAE